MCGTAAAASSRSTVMRTSSEPARASAATCATVAVDVGRVGVGHRLHDDRRAAADRDRAVADADGDRGGAAARLRRGGGRACRQARKPGGGAGSRGRGGGRRWSCGAAYRGGARDPAMNRVARGGNFERKLLEGVTAAVKPEPRDSVNSAQRSRSPRRAGVKPALPATWSRLRASAGAGLVDPPTIVADEERDGVVRGDGGGHMRGKHCGKRGDGRSRAPPGNRAPGRPKSARDGGRPCPRAPSCHRRRAASPPLQARRARGVGRG